MWKNIVESDTPQITKWRMRIACWISEATNTLSEYVIPLFHGSKVKINVTQPHIIRTLLALFNYFVTVRESVHYP